MKILIICATCSRKCYRDHWEIKRNKNSYCSKICKHIGNGKVLINFYQNTDKKPRDFWKPESEKSFKEKMKGAGNNNWKGGITYKNKKGNYIAIKYIKCPKEFISMARKDGYIMEHRLIMAIHLKRCLSRLEVVHHKNHLTRDNRIENLMIFPNNIEHKLYEGRISRGEIIE